jgi:hypothetical protein
MLLTSNRLAALAQYLESRFIRSEDAIWAD